jgi:hypothetical protein
MPTKKAKTTKTKTKTKTKPNGKRVTVRMFCQGLGDCFLITVPQAGATQYSILIDCGVAMGTPQADTIMGDVVTEIARLTGGVVDLLVVTHQHWDHVSGFVQATDALGAITFKHLWLAWTENPIDGLARDLRAEFAKAKVALDRATQMAASLSATDPASAARLTALDGVVAFFGPAAAGEETGTKDLTAAMAVPSTLVGGTSAIDYLLPGTSRTLPGATSGMASEVQAFVLGPPHDRAKLMRINPSTRNPETYDKTQGDAPGLAINWGWTAGATHSPSAAGAALDASLDPDFARSQPFDRKSGISFEAAQTDPFFAAHYFDPRPEIQARRIDGDWLWSGAQRLALRMDTYTNNTSLVLAFELPGSKDVLLFAGDAQVGNWLSWHDHDFATADGRTLSATDLLGSTRLYKVAHHGSHNATLKEKGLDLMTHPGLVAMLPVEADGVTRLGYGQMPLRSLVAALREKTSGRILRIDEAWSSDTAPGTWDGRGASATLAAKRISVGKAETSSERNLFMEYVVDDHQGSDGR